MNKKTIDSSNILFSSVRGAPSFVHSPYVNLPSKIKSGSYLSILDPDVELPELSTKDIEEFLSDPPNKKLKDDVNIQNSINQDITIVPKSLILPRSQSTEKQDTIPLFYKCSVRNCNQQFESKADQMEHFIQDHKDKVVYCPTCSNAFKSKYSLQNHFLLKPGCKLKNTYRCILSNVQDPNKKCDKYFFSKHKLELHIHQVHNISSISSFYSSPTSTTNPCNSKFFDVTTRDEQHIKKVNLSETSYPCNQCNNIYLDFSTFKRHLANGHCSSSDIKLIPLKITISASASQQLTESPVVGNVESTSQSTEPRPTSENVVYGCPLPECGLLRMTSCDEFRSHFLRHFTGEIPGDINSLLPPDPPEIPGLKLHSKTLEANMDSLYQREETNLLDALDLVPDKLLHDNMQDLMDFEGSCTMPDLTSALILPPTIASSMLNQQPAVSISRKFDSFTDQVHSEFTNVQSDSLVNFSSNQISLSQSETTHIGQYIVTSGLCSRTCPRVASSLITLLRKRRRLLRDNPYVPPYSFDPLVSTSSSSDRHQATLRRLFNQQSLPDKYSEVPTRFHTSLSQ